MTIARPLLVLALVAGGLVAAVADATPAAADPTHLVTNGNDSGAGSYRQAVIDASADTTPPVEIEFDPGIEVDLVTVSSITYSGTHDLVINGNGSTIDGQGTTVPALQTGTANVEINDLTITRAGDASAGALRARGSGDLTINDSTLDANVSTNGFAAIDSGPVEVNINRSTISNHTQGYSAVFSTGPITVTESQFIGNDTPDSGGAIQGGVVDIADSTFRSNQATVSGGAVKAIGGLTATNSTFTENSAVVSGGALEVSAATTSLTHSTLASNTAPTGAQVNSPGGTDTFTGTVFSDPLGGGDNCVGPASTSSYSYSTDGSCDMTGVGDTANGADPGLSLDTGPPVVLMPSAASPLINAIPANSCTLTTDQLGNGRGAASGCDIGAVETPKDRPDNHIRKGSGPWVGNNRYNTTGANQSRFARVRKGGKITYYVRIQNDGNITDSYKVKGDRHGRKWIVNYFKGGTNISRGVKAGTYQFIGVAPGATRTVKVVVKPKSSAKKGNQKVVKVTSTSLDPAALKDTVKATTRRR